MTDRLALTRDQLRSDLGFHAGWGRDPAGWNQDQVAAIDMAIRGGLQRFYFQALTQGGKAYEWSFLSQSHFFATVEDQREYDLPLDFCNHMGEVLFDDSDTGYATVPIANIAKVQELQSRHPQAKGVPQWAAVREKRTQGVVHPQKELIIFPLPDTAYSMRILYQITSQMPTDSIVTFPGGSAHARTILYACLVEMKRVDGMADFEGDYQMALAASVSQDGRQDRGFMGLNTDPGVEHAERRYLNPSSYSITIDGLSEAP